MTITRLAFFWLAMAMTMAGCALANDDQKYVQEWNAHRSAVACVAKDSHHKVCSTEVDGPDDSDKPPRLPEGYKAVFYTDGCPKCAVGWVIKKGKCDMDLNCYD